jgi:hypothetical protein
MFGWCVGWCSAVQVVFPWLGVAFLIVGSVVLAKLLRRK